MELKSAVDTHSGGLEAQNGALRGLWTSGCRFPSFTHYDKQDPDSLQSDDPRSREFNDAIFFL
jgi:hypothetical protein